MLLSDRGTGPTGRLARAGHGKYPVRYLPAYPRWFVVDQGTPEDAARRSACIALNVQLAELTSRALLSPADATLTTARDELQKQVVAACAR